MIEIPGSMIPEDCGEIVIRLGGEERQEQGRGAMMCEYMSHLADGLRSEGRERTAEIYLSAMRSLRGYLGNGDMAISGITPERMAGYECYLRRRGLQSNTTSFYMRVVRAAYNKAVRAGMTPDRRPFVGVFTGKSKTAKRAVSIDMIRKIKGAMPEDYREEEARDIFMFSFYTRGMSFVDIANLRKDDVRDGCLVYRRRKTGQTIRMAWHEAMQEIVDRHPPKDGIHLIGLIDEGGKSDVRRQCHARQYAVNKALRQLSRHIGMAKPLTMYAARHSWATIARDMGIPIEIISSGMGHTSEQTTRIYLRSIDAEEIDTCNERVIGAVWGSPCIYPRETHVSMRHEK